ncbi:MAG: AAA family ATPase [Cyanobacteria bacterium P01_G01_bin.54]
MKIKSIDIKGIGGIRDLHLDFDDRLNFICGPNGIGKTTILECIAHAFSSGRSNILKRNIFSEKGVLEVTAISSSKTHKVNMTITNFNPEEFSFSGLAQYAINLLSIKIDRDFQYQAVQAVSRDPGKALHSFNREAVSGVQVKEVKSWFLNRHLYSAHPNSLTSQQIHNIELAKKCFSILRDDISFNRVLADTNDIMISTPNGEIYYEYLSSGFKSCISILFSIIKDIEFRFKDPSINAEDFDGIILIDELELHLHPEWQAKISRALVEIFPKAQFITTTHSPHIIQNAKFNEIIALEFRGSDVGRRQIHSGQYGFQGWTVEEILMDVMGMPDTRTAVYHQAIAEFEKAIEQENYVLAKQSYEKLNQLLHPNNHLRKLLKFDLASIREAS